MSTKQIEREKRKKIQIASGRLQSAIKQKTNLLIPESFVVTFYCQFETAFH